MADQMNRGGNRPQSGNRTNYRGTDNRTGGEKRQGSGENRGFGGGKRSFGGSRGTGRPSAPRSFGKVGENGGERHGFADRNGEQRPEKRGFGNKVGERSGMSRPNGGFRSDRPARPVGDRPARPMGNRPARPVGDRPAFRGPARPVAKPVSDGLPSRRLALEILRGVTENGAYASLLLDEKLRTCGLPHMDRRLVSRLVYDTLEHLTYLDWVLNQVMARPDTDIKLRNILRLGACQILLEDRIPESAATNTCVNLCKEIGMEGLAGVCNGILRNLIRGKENFAIPQDDSMESRVLRYSMPAWLIGKLDSDWGNEWTDAFLGCKARETVTVRPNLTRVDDAEFQTLLDKKVWEAEPAAIPHAWHVSGMADIGADSDFTGGNFSIQGEGSMLACMALTPKRGQQVLDACAAPGGKACFIAELMGGTGRVQAWELHAHRTELIGAQARRLGLDNVRPVTRDASVARPEMAQTMDAVLLDAPCSGMGTLADKPDIRLRVTEESMNELTSLQSKLLDAVSTCVKKGGVLVYSTCSVMKDENERQVTAFLERHPDFVLDKLPETIPEQYRQYENVGLQLTPARDGLSGFYLARMRRKR